MIRFDEVFLKNNKTDGFLLSNINLKIDSGAITGVAGPSGCGKSSFLSLFSKNYNYSGSILLDAAEINQLSKKDFFKTISTQNDYKFNFNDKVINIIHQSFLLTKDFFKPISLSNLENVDYYLKVFSLESCKFRKFNNLSDSQKAKTILCSAFSRKSNLLILKNPQHYLDYKDIKTLKNEIKKYTLSGKNHIIVESEDLTLLTEICDKIIIIDKGIIQDYKFAKDYTDRDLSNIFDTEIIFTKNIGNGNNIIINVD